jgi:hypothetical protein
MTDIATLGLAVDSRQVTTANGELDKLAVVAGRAQTAAGNLTKAAAGVASTVQAHGQAASNAAKKTDELSDAAGKAARAHGGLSTQAMAASHAVRSMTEQLALGASPMQILLQQMNHLSYAASGSGGLSGAFGEVFGSLGRLITPVTLMAGGIAALGIATIASFSSWKNYALALDDVSKRAGMLTSEMSRLQAAASFKGIAQNNFFKAMDTFSQQVYLAQHNMGGLGDVLRNNGIHARTFNEYLEGAANIISRVTEEEQKYELLRQMGLPATAEWVRLLSGGADGIRKAKEQAAAFGGAANDQMVAKAREFDEAWNRTWTNFGRGWRSVAVGIFTGLDTMIQKGRAALSDLSPDPSRTLGAVGRTMLKSGSYGKPMADDFGDFYKATGAPNGRNQLTVTKPVVDPEATRHSIELEQQRLGILGQLTGVAGAVAQKENEIKLARSNGVEITKDEISKLLLLAQVQAESARSARALQFGIMDQAQAMENAKREIQTLIDDGTIKSTQDYANAWAVVTKRIRDASDQAQVARSPLEQLTRYGLDGSNAFKQFDQVAVSSFGNVENAFVSFASGTKSAKDAFHDMATAILQDIEKMIIRMAVTAPLAKALGGAFGLGMPGGMQSPNFIGPPIPAGFGAGHSGMIIGGMPTFTKSADPGVFGGARRYHTGGVPGLGHDEVPIIARKGEGIFTPEQMKAMGGMRSGAGPVTIHVNNAPAGTQASATASTDSSGGTRVDIWLKRQIDDAVAAHIDTGQSSVNQSMERRYGLTPRL